MPSSQATKIQEGTQCIRWWYDASGLELTGVSFDDAVFRLTKDPSTTIWLHPENLGEAYEAAGAARAQDAMQSLGSANQGKIPAAQAFFDVLLNAVDPTTITNFLSIVKDSVVATAEEVTTTVADYGTFGLKSAYWIALGGLALFAVIYATSTAKRFS